MGRLSLFLLVLATGCVNKWQVQGASPEAIVAATPSREFLVRRKDGAQVQVRSAHIEADSLIGVELDDPSGPPVQKRCAIALSDIASIAVRERDKAFNTVLLVVGLTMVTYIGLMALFSAGVD